MKFIVGKKIEMSQIFKEDGKVVPVTLIQAGPCYVTQIRTKNTDGYSAVQVGYGEKNKVGKSTQGRIKGINKNLAIFKEFRVSDEASSLQKGQEITVNVFTEGDKVKVTGESKGKGFAGVVKRYGFKGHSNSHGTKDQVRMPGSTGSTGPAHVFKGVRKPGRMGGDQVTVANLEIIKKDSDNNILYIKGAVPGARNSIISLYCDGVMDFTAPIKEVELEVAPVIESAEVKTEEKKEEQVISLVVESKVNAQEVAEAKEVENTK